MGTAKREVKQFAGDTTIHGIAELWIFGRIGKFIWFCGLISVLVFTAAQVVEIVGDIVQQPTMTSISEENEIDPPPVMVLYTMGKLATGSLQAPESYVKAITGMSHENAPDVSTMKNEVWDIYKGLLNSYIFVGLGSKSWEMCPELALSDTARNSYNKFSKSSSKKRKKRANYYGDVDYSANNENDNYIYGNDNDNQNDNNDNNNDNHADANNDETASDDSNENSNSKIDVSLMEKAAKALLEENENDIQKMMHSLFKNDVKAPRIISGQNEAEALRFVSPMGLSFKFNLSTDADASSSLNPTKKTSTTLVEMDCSDEYIQYSAKIGYDYHFNDKIDPNLDPGYGVGKLLCRYAADKITLRLKVRTYDERYCKKDMTHRCTTSCFITQARKKKSCLRYLGVPHLRTDIPLCNFQEDGAAPCDGSIAGWCAKECAKDSLTHKPCLQVAIVSIKQSGVGSPVSTALRNFTVVIERGRGFEHIHLAPKYNIANAIGSLGGIIGVGFGISFISMAQVAIFCGSLFKALCAKK